MVRLSVCRWFVWLSMDPQLQLVGGWVLLTCLFRGGRLVVVFSLFLLLQCSGVRCWFSVRRWLCGLMVVRFLCRQTLQTSAFFWMCFLQSSLPGVILFIGQIYLLVDPPHDDFLQMAIYSFLVEDCCLLCVYMLLLIYRFLSHEFLFYSFFDDVN